LELQEELRERFDKEPVVLVCTQVAEVSLDLNAMLVISDLAPFTSLVQIAGRLHRVALIPKRTAELIVLEVERVVPYTSGEMRLAKRLVEMHDGQDLSQTDMAMIIRDFVFRGETFRQASIFTEAPHHCLQQDIREEKYIKVPIVIMRRGENLGHIRKLSKEELQLRSCPLPQPKNRSAWAREKGFLIALPGQAWHNPTTGGQLR
jgi:CRISPR-associated endonuclease/helicase Cas3